MIRRTPTCFALTALLGIALAACSDDAPTTGDSQDLTERQDVAFDVTGWVISSSGSKDSWQAACDAWVTQLKKVAPADAVRTYECGEAKETSGSLLRYASTPVAHLVTSLPRGSEPLVFDAVHMVGSSGAHASLTSACNAQMDRIAAIYGPRMLGATCGEAQELPGSVLRYGAPLTVWVEPPSGTELEVSGYVIGGSSSWESWKEACDAYVAGVVALTGADHLGAHSCGEAQEAAGSLLRYESTATASIRVQLEKGSEPEKVDLGMVTGQSSSLSAWQTACTAALEAARAQHAERFLTGYCDAPQQAGGSLLRYESKAYAWVGDRARPEPEGSGGAGGGGDSGGAGGAGGTPGTEPPCADATPASDCMTRCLAMMDTCDAGPAQQTCDFICGAAPTECELACGEKTSCEQIGDWFDVCNLGE